MKKASSKQLPSAPTETGTPAIRILKIATCPTLSGKSTLTYHLGCAAESGIHFRVHGNTGGGFFNQDWVSLATIQQLLDKQPDDKPITSQLLYPIFRGKSLNTPAFLLAVLKAEGLISSSKDKKRSHECNDLAGFLAEVKTLIASSVDLKVAEKAKAVKLRIKASKPVTKTVSKSPLVFLEPPSSAQVGEQAETT